MGNKLDSIIKKRMIEGPILVDSDITSTVVDMSGVENSFSVQLDYENGITLDAVISIEVSVDGNSYVEIPKSIQNITDATGTHIWDFTELGSNHIRISIVINAGSMDVIGAVFSGKRRH